VEVEEVEEKKEDNVEEEDNEGEEMVSSQDIELNAVFLSGPAGRPAF
jgi:hypothetical protein